jgi:hypothetical protein
MQQNNLVVLNGHALSTSTFEKMTMLANARGVKIGSDISPSSGEKVKEPLASRIKKSKFNALLEDMSDDQLKATAIALMFDTKIQEAVKMYHTAVGHYTQAASIAYQLDKRGIKLY